MLVACCRQTSSKILKQMLEEAGISHLSLQAVDFEYIQRNCQLLDQVDAVYASPLVYHDVREVSPQLEKVFMFNLRIDRTNISVLKARLAAIQLGKITALSN